MIVPKCINGNPAISICVTDDCDNENPFICSNDDCNTDICKSLHKDCMFITNWNTFKAKIQKSNKLPSPEFLDFCKTVEEVISKSIKSLQKQLIDFEVWKQSYGMLPEAVTLFKSVQENEENKFTGSRISNLLKNAKKQIISQTSVNYIKIKDSISQIEDNMMKIKKMIKQLYSEQRIDKDKNKNKHSSLIEVETKSQQIKNNQPLPIKMTQHSTIKINKTSTTPLLSQQISIKMKQIYLCDLNKKLIKLQEKPTHLELKLQIASYCLVLAKFFIQLYVNNNLGLICETYLDSNIQSNKDVIITDILDNLKKYIAVLNDKQLRMQLYLHNQLKQLAKALKNTNLNSLKTLTLYAPWILGQHLVCIRNEDQVCASLMDLPELQSLKIIAHGVKSMEGFKNLGNKVHIYQDKGWAHRQDW